jgi:hypothetical protein
LSAVLLVADEALVQWTSLVVPPVTLAVDFVVTATVLAAVVGPIVVFAVARRPASGRILSTPARRAVLLRRFAIRTEKLCGTIPPLVLMATSAYCGTSSAATTEASMPTSPGGRAVARRPSPGLRFYLRPLPQAIVVLGLLALATAVQRLEPLAIERHADGSSRLHRRCGQASS